MVTAVVVAAVVVVALVVVVATVVVAAVVVTEALVVVVVTLVVVVEGGGDGGGGNCALEVATKIVATSVAKRRKSDLINILMYMSLGGSLEIQILKEKRFTFIQINFLSHICGVMSIIDAY